MITIKLVDARKGLHSKCVELFKDLKIAESIYRYLCDGIEECEYYAESERKKPIQCKDCMHRPYLVPAKYDSSGKCLKYGYITSPDDVCPFLCDDSWYNRVPEDNFFCGFGERKETEDEKVF